MILNIKNHEKILMKENKIFFLKKGKAITKSISMDGKIISNHMIFWPGDLVFDCLNFFNKNNFLEIELEIDALEHCILEEIRITKENESEIYEKMLLQLMKKNLIEIQYQIYNSKGYILTILKLLGNDLGELEKNKIKLEYFNIGKTQFYKIYKELKEEKLLEEKEEKLYLNIKQIDKYLEKLLYQT